MYKWYNYVIDMIKNVVWMMKSKEEYLSSNVFIDLFFVFIYSLNLCIIFIFFQKYFQFL